MGMVTHSRRLHGRAGRWSHETRNLVESVLIAWVADRDSGQRKAAKAEPRRLVEPDSSGLIS